MRNLLLFLSKIKHREILPPINNNHRRGGGRGRTYGRERSIS
jgi:hypothetical protein